MGAKDKHTVTGRTGKYTETEQDQDKSKAFFYVNGLNAKMKQSYLSGSIKEKSLFYDSLGVYSFSVLSI